MCFAEQVDLEEEEDVWYENHGFSNESQLFMDPDYKKDLNTQDAATKLITSKCSVVDAKFGLYLR